MKAWIVALGIVLAGCGDSTDGRVCSVNADCASMLCLADGTCAPIGTDSGTSDSATMEDGAMPDGGDADSAADSATPTDGSMGDSSIPGCSANHDGVITRDEVPLMAGLRANFRTANDVTVSTAGDNIGGGRRRWDLSGDLDGDHAVLVETLDPSGYWFAGDFPEASYVSRLNDTDDLLGVFQITPSELALLGVASPDDSLTATNVSHDPPVTTLAFPLSAGATWDTSATVSGTNLGLIAAWTEDYTSEVDAEGELITPFGTFEVLRVKVVLERTVGLLVTTVRTFLFVSECFGTVAAITSQDNERRAEFTTAAEVRRLAP